MSSRLRLLVRVEGCGVCASSLPLWEGRPWFDAPLEPGAPGHEVWGRLEGGDLDGVRVACLSSHGFATHDVAAETEIVPLPEALDGKPFPGEALGCAMNAFERSNVRAGQTVAVVGTGFLGLLLVQLCVAAGAHVLAFSRRAFALGLARRFGAETPDPQETPDACCDVAIEAAGVQSTLDLASRLVRERGRLVVAGYHQDGDRRIDLRSWNWRGLDVVNAHERDPQRYVSGIRAAVEAVVSGRLDPAPLYTHTLPLDRIGDAFALVRDRPPGFVKALVTP